MRWARLLVLTALVAASATVVDHATAANGSARAERERVRREQAQKAAEIDALRAEDHEVEAALAAVTAQVTAQQQALASAEQAVAASEAEAAAAKVAEQAIEEEIAVLRASLREMVVQEYITGGRLQYDEEALQTDDLSERARRSVFADLVVGSATVVGEQLKAASEDLTLARERAEDAAAAALVRRNEVDAKLSELAAARDQQTAFATKLDARIESRLAEAAALTTLDSKLSAQIAAEQAALARRNIGGGRTSSSSYQRGSIRLRTVRGITVNAQIADALDRMLGAAADDGIVFGGGGYRDPAQQQALREAHCPDPESSPASSCSPPTARPGYSMHERGLAIDFTTNGRTLTSGSAGYRWLQVHAASYGLYNLPGEPWHWSTNGN